MLKAPVLVLIGSVSVLLSAQRGQVCSQCDAAATWGLAADGALPMLHCRTSVLAFCSEVCEA